MENEEFVNSSEKAVSIFIKMYSYMADNIHYKGPNGKVEPQRLIFLKDLNAIQPLELRRDVGMGRLTNLKGLLQLTRVLNKKNVWYSNNFVWSAYTETWDITIGYTN